MPPPRELLSLNGIWEIAPGDRCAPQDHWTSRVEVPSLVDTASPPYAWREFPYHWYRVRFMLPYEQRAETVLLLLEQAMYGTEVHLNGKLVGRDIACYTSQEYDVTSAIRRGDENLLTVRVGARETLPPESAVGNDQERDVWIPGLWGDAWIVRTGNPRIRRVQVIPRIADGAVEVRVTVRNAAGDARGACCLCRVVRGDTGASGPGPATARAVLPARSETVLALEVPVPDARLWSPDDPFLYTLETQIESGGSVQDRLETRFGMREFRIEGGDFVLNGKKILLRGGNIAFHRFLSDADRGCLPWDLEWAKRVLIDIPKGHHFNSFRVHLGQMYNRWYDLADLHGMLIQNEWPFWTRTGSEAQIRHEFRRWLEDNWNHPSIVLWDPMNESYDDFVVKQAVPEMKELDPTRPWEMSDFTDEHPYIYSLGPVLTDRTFGFSRPLEEIERSSTPSVVNEFLWWWLDPDNNPTVLTRDVLERWLGANPDRAEIIAHQSFLAQELIELFRRMNVDAIQPFVYLSNGRGPTGHWFLGDVKNLEPKPVLAAVANSLSPFGVSVELWDRHFIPGERRKVRIHVFNDEGAEQAGMLRWGCVDGEGRWVPGPDSGPTALTHPVADPAAEIPDATGQLSARDIPDPARVFDPVLASDAAGGGVADPTDRAYGERPVCVAATSSSILEVEFAFPLRPGRYEARAELTRLEAGASGGAYAVSRKPAHVIESPQVSGSLKGICPCVLEESGEILQYLHVTGIGACDLASGGIGDCDILVVADGMARGEAFRHHSAAIAAFVASGGALVLIEPEYGVETEATLAITREIAFEIRKRKDTDRGGYDSHVFMDDPAHPVWTGIDQEHLKFFNGGFGGEIVSQHDVTCTAPMRVLARCGLKLATVAAAEVDAGDGTILLSRLQIRGRLRATSEGRTLYGRRVDPVAQRFLLNILETYGRRGR